MQSSTHSSHSIGAEQFPGPIDQIDHDEEDSDAADVLVNVDDFGPWVSGGSYSMTNEDYDALLLELEESKSPYDEAWWFLLKQAGLKLRTWSANKELKKA